MENENTNVTSASRGLLTKQEILESNNERHFNSLVGLATTIHVWKTEMKQKPIPTVYLT